MWARLSVVYAMGVFSIFCLPLPLSGQEPEAFQWIGSESGPAPSFAAAGSWQVAARFDVLRTAPPRLALPFAWGEARAAVLTAFERRSVEDYTWRGRLEEGEGSVTLTVHGASLAGFIEEGNTVYEIVPRERGISSLVLLDPDDFPECGTGNEQAVEPDSGAEEAAVPAAPDTAARIDVMVLYTAKTRAAAGGTANIQATAQAAIDAANTAYANSQISQRVRLVYTGEVTYDETTGDYYAHLSWLTADPAVAALRQTYHADLVDLMVEDAQYCGLSWLMTSVGPSFAGSAFSVVTRSCAVGNFSLAHELGHNMGAHHDPANGGTAAYPYAYGHFVSGAFRTVMSYSSQCTASCPRVSRFSNPDISYLGYPTGIAEARDNHRTLNATAAVVANFRQDLGASDFYTLSPCRVADTRGISSPLLSGTVRVFNVAGVCGIPADARAVALNVTVVGATGSGDLSLHPSDQVKPQAAAIAFMAGVVRANNVTLPLPDSGAGTLTAEAVVNGGGTVHLAIDVFGYFAAPAADEEAR